MFDRIFAAVAAAWPDHKAKITAAATALAAAVGGLLYAAWQVLAAGQ